MKLPLNLPGFFHAAARGLSLMALIAVIAAHLTAQVPELEVGVRSKVVDRGPGREPGGRHGKVYGLLSVEIIKQKEKLVRPVDAYALWAQVQQELHNQGFVEAQKGQKPDILISVLYGRSWLENPWMGGTNNTQLSTSAEGRYTGSEPLQPMVQMPPSAMAGASPHDMNATRPVPDEAPTVEFDTGSLASMIRMRENGNEAKLQKDEAEKLCIIVTAWKYPADRKAKPKCLWVTTMVTDDPEHRDLNLISGEMLASGSAYFDREPKDVEVFAYRKIPEGKVEIGPSQVVPPKK